MKVGFAVQANEGIESKVFNHFGSAPVFIIVDAAGEEIAAVVREKLSALFAELGFEITDFRIEGTDFDADTCANHRRQPAIQDSCHYAGPHVRSRLQALGSRLQEELLSNCPHDGVPQRDARSS